MEVRSYYATTVEAAVDLARRELGREAMLIQSRRSPAELAHLGRYEVVFAAELILPAAPPVRRAVKPVGRPSSPSQGADASSLADEEVAAIKPVDLTRGRNGFASLLESAGVSRTGVRQPLENDPRPQKQHKTTPTAPTSQSANEKTPSIGALIGDLSREISCQPGLGRGDSATPSVAFVGNPGAGKTATLMKIAVNQGMSSGAPVRIFSLDHLRVGASEALRRFSGLLEIPFCQCQTTGELGERLDTRFEGLTLVDTSGMGRGQEAELAALAACLAPRPHIEVQLVLRADLKTADNLFAIERFSALEPGRLILTGMDATSEFRELRCVLDAAAIPVSFLGTGQKVPDDLVPAHSARLAELILCGRPEAARAAA